LNQLAQGRALWFRQSLGRLDSLASVERGTLKPLRLKIPKITAGSYFPSLLAPASARRERALHAFVVEAYVKGVSRRKVVDLVKSLGIGGISSSQVSRICKVLDTQVEAFRSRALEGQYPYVGLNAAYHKIKELGRVVCHGPVTSMTFSMGANI